jgi:hypothetical protein
MCITDCRHLYLLLFGGNSLRDKRPDKAAASGEGVAFLVTWDEFTRLATLHKEGGCSEARGLLPHSDGKGHHGGFVLENDAIEFLKRRGKLKLMDYCSTCYVLKRSAVQL